MTDAIHKGRKYPEYATQGQELAQRLIHHMDEPPTVTTHLAIALRAALHLCAEDQELAENCIALLDRRPPGDKGKDMSLGIYLGRIETTNKVIRYIADALKDLPLAVPASGGPQMMGPDRETGEFLSWGVRG
jgi:hypothetical protein